MNIWIVGLLIIGAALPLVHSENDDDDDYEVKRFHVQSRNFGGNPTCVETRRRKRSPSQSNGVKDSYGAAPAEDEPEIGASTGLGGTDSTSGILLQNSDLLGNSGVLVIRNQAANTPVLFELRPVATDPSDIYYENDYENSPDADDDDNDVDFEDNESDDDVANDESQEVTESDNKDNRYKPSGNLANNSGEVEQTTEKKPRVQTTTKPKRKPSSGSSSVKRKKPSKKRNRISNAPVRRKKNNRRKRPNKNRNSNKKKRKSTKRRKPSKKRKPTKKRNRNKTRRPSRNRYDYYYTTPTTTYVDNQSNRDNRNGNSVNTQQSGNRQDSNSNRRKNIGEDVNKGSGEKTVSRTMTTTRTGTAADVNCIIITKEPTTTTPKPFWNILGRNVADSEDRSFGHRKRFKNRFQIATA